MMASYEEIEAAQERVEALKSEYLKRHGWSLTCHSPGSYWVWQRDFSDVDARSREWWERTKVRVESAVPPRRPPSEPKTFGVRHLPTDMAIGATRQLLDQDEREGVEG